MKKLIFLIVVLGIIVGFGGCKEDPSTMIETEGMSEEEIYFTDYEVPQYKWGYINEDGRLIITDKFDNTRDFSDGLAATNFKGKWGYIDTKGNIVIEHKYRSAFPFKKGIARVQNFDQLYGFIDKTGREVLPCRYPEAYDADCGLIKIKTDNGYNYITTLGDTLLPQPVNKVGNFKDGYAIFKDFGKEGLLDASGKILLDYNFDKIYPPQGQLIRVKLDKKYGVVNPVGKELIPLSYDKLTPFQNDIAAAQSNDSWQLISKTNQIKFKFDKTVKNVIDMNEDRWMVYDGDNYAIMDSKGKRLTGFDFDALNKFHESIAVYEKDDAYGYVTKDGVLITEPIFPLCWDFVGDKARAIFNRGVGFLDKNGNVAIPANFFEVRDFNDGLARVQVYR